jgi:hypothetical protein
MQLTSRKKGGKGGCSLMTREVQVERGGIKGEKRREREREEEVELSESNLDWQCSRSTSGLGHRQLKRSTFNNHGGARGSPLQLPLARVTNSCSLYKDHGAEGGPRQSSLSEYVVRRGVSSG